jgi:hypothetical protein
MLPLADRTTRIVALALVLLVGACRSAAVTGESAAAAQSAGEPQPEPAVKPASCSGVWQSTYGTLRLQGTNEHVTGTYTDIPGSTLTGRLEANVLRGTYHEPARIGAGARGRLAFAFAPDGESFAGVWAVGDGPPLEPDSDEHLQWSGRRLVAESGRLWFVVLEENWEASLREPEYSFGAMLRAFFERVPSVGFRHRFVHDRADLERFCAELDTLVEPVVLYIAAHGTPESLGIGPEGISPEALGAALRGGADLRLLHLGSCAMLAGDAPERIRAAAGKDFPISGFVESVDWAASAVVDFTYMQLVLEQGLEPSAAVAETRRMLTFANGPGETGVWPGCDLKLSERAGP